MDGDGYQIKPIKNLNTIQSSYEFRDGCTTVADIDLDNVPDVVVNSGRRQGSIRERGVYVWNKSGLVHFFKQSQN